MWFPHIAIDLVFVLDMVTSDKYDVNYIWLEVECWNEDETHAARQSPTQF